MENLNKLAKNVSSMLEDLKIFYKRQTYIDRKQKEIMNDICRKFTYSNFPLSLGRGAQGVRSILSRPPPIFPVFFLRTNTVLIP
jgi:hypothetical protein